MTYFYKAKVCSRSLPPSDRGSPSFSTQSSMNRMAIQALEKMETRKFKAKGKGLSETSCGASDSLSSSSTSDCAICLEKYMDGEVRRSAAPSICVALAIRGFWAARVKLCQAP